MRRPCAPGGIPAKLIVRALARGQSLHDGHAKKGENMTSAKPHATASDLLRAFVGISALAFGILSTPASAQQTATIRLGHVGFPGSLFDITANKFAQDVNAALKGKVEVKVFHSSQLGSDEAMIKGIRVG